MTQEDRNNLNAFFEKLEERFRPLNEDADIYGKGTTEQEKVSAAITAAFELGLRSNEPEIERLRLKVEDLYTELDLFAKRPITINFQHRGWLRQLLGF